MYFFRKELCEGKDFNNQNAGAIGLAKLFQKIHKSDSVAKYAMYGYTMNDSVYAEMVTKDVERLQAVYDYNRHQEIARRETEKAAERILYIWICIGIILFLLLTLAVSAILLQAVKQNNKKIEEQYHQSLNAIEQARKDIKKLQLYESLNKELIAEKEKLILEQEKTIKELLQKEETGQELASNDFKSTTIYLDFYKSIGNGLEPKKSKWVDFQDKLFRAYPNFSEFMNDHYDNMSDNEYKICLLIRADFKPVSIGAALGLPPSTMTQIRKNLCFTLFGKHSDSKNFDKLLKRIY